MRKLLLLIMLLSIPVTFAVIPTSSDLPVIGGNTSTWGYSLNNVLTDIFGVLNQSFNTDGSLQLQINTSLKDYIIEELDNTTINRSINLSSYAFISQLITNTFNSTENQIKTNDSSALVNITGSFAVNQIVTDLNITGEVIPSVHNTFDVGNSSYRWRGGYFGTLSIEDTSPTVTIAPTTGGVSKESTLSLYRTTGAGTQTLSGDLKTSVGNLYLSNTEGGNLYLRSVGGGYVLLNPAGGNVGIGTASPTGAKLHIISGTENGLQLDTTAGSSNSIIFSGSGTGYWTQYLDSSHNFVIREYGVADRMTFKAGGNVGIGDSTPDATLETLASLFVSEVESGNGDILSITNTATIFNDDGSDRDFTIESDTNANHFVSNAGLFAGKGSFGIGSAPLTGDRAYVYFAPPTISSSATATSVEHFLADPQGLTIDGGAVTTSATIILREPTITLANGGTVNDAYTFVIQSSPTEGTRNGALWVDSGESRFDENVGIGVTDPTVRLEVSGDELLDGNLRIEGTSSELRLIAGRNIYVNSSENSADANIFVSQAGAGDFSSEAGHLILQPRVQGTVYRDIIFASGLTRGSSIMRITGEGNVGIGTSTPSSTLEVIGTANASIIKAGDYYSGDGTQGFTGICASTTTLTVKDGLITACA